MIDGRTFISSLRRGIYKHQGISISVGSTRVNNTNDRICDCRESYNKIILSLIYHLARVE